MKKYKPFYLAVFLVSIMLTTSGCIQVKTGKENTSGIDGGVFKSVNRGSVWSQVVMVPNVSGRPQSIAGTNVNSFSMDPNDNNALYYGSVGTGLFYTYDAGATWRLATTLGQGTVSEVVVDPASKCIIYSSIGNRLMKSNDCTRTWNQSYYDNNPTTLIQGIAVDHYNTNIIYIGTSRGELIKSSDSGESWQTVYRMEDLIEKIVINPNDSRIIYVITRSKGVYATKNGGTDWYVLKGLEKALQSNSLGMDIRDLILIKKEPGLMFVSTYLGIIKSKDDGNTWEKIELIPAQPQTNINTMAISQENADEIYYITNTTFYRSSDGGANWTTIKLPGSRAGWKLLIDPTNSNIIYLAVRSLAG